MKHPQHDLLIAAANDVDARFTNSLWITKFEIEAVIKRPDLDWKLVDKFAELKKAEQEGKKIEWLCRTGEWFPKHIAASWEVDGKYRIKPEPVYEWQWLCRAPDGLFFTSAFFTNPPPYAYNCIEESKREVKS